MLVSPLAVNRLRQPSPTVRKRQRLRVPRRYNGIEFEARVANEAVFVPPERLAALCSEDLQPVRQFAEYKGQANKPGFTYWDGRHLGYESRLELSVFETAAFLADVQLLREQPFRLHFGRRKAPFSHVPDLLVGRSQLTDPRRFQCHELVVVDIKGARQIEKNERVFTLTRDALAETGVDYAIAVEPDPVILRNIQFLRGCQFPSLGSEDLVNPLTAAVAGGPVPLGELAEDIASATAFHPAVVRPALFHLLYIHALSFDVSSLLSDRALVGPAAGPEMVVNRTRIEPWQPLDQLLGSSVREGSSMATRRTTATHSSPETPPGGPAASVHHSSKSRPSWTVTLDDCSALHYDGQVWEIRSADRRYVKLRNGSDLRIVHLEELLADADFHIVDEHPPPHEPAAAYPTPDLVSQEGRNENDRRVEGIRLMLTGYRLGYPDPDGDGAYDDKRFNPARTLQQRRMALADDFGVDVRTIRRWEDKYKASGAVCDRRRSGMRPTQDRWPRARAAAWDVLAEMPYGSKVADHELRRRVRRRMELEAASEADRSCVTEWLPPPRTFSRMLDTLDPRRASKRARSQKNLRSEAETPNSPYHPVRACRPLEIVEIDCNRFDCLAANPAAALHKRADPYLQLCVTVAVDQYTHKILAWRFTAGEPDACDASLLLYDLVYPKHVREGWPLEECQWCYSVPEHIVAFLDPIELPVASGAFGVPTSVTVDRGKIFKSDAFREACRRLGIGIQYARVETGYDKGTIERTFGAISTEFLQAMPGYKGSDVHGRGDVAHVELAALPWVEELESDFAEWVYRYHDKTPIKELTLPGRPEIALSPDEMYEHALTFAGLPRIPVGSDVFIELLPGAWRTIQNDGIQLNYLTYQGPALKGRHYRKSPVRSRHGEWLIKYDRRDRSTIYFWSPDSDDAWNVGTWERLTVRGDDRPRPFGDQDLAYAKHVLERRSGVVNSDRLLDVLDDILDRREQQRIPDRQEARLYGLWVTEQAQRQADQESRLRHAEPVHPPSPLVVSPSTSPTARDARIEPGAHVLDDHFDAGAVVELEFDFDEGGDEELGDEE